MEKKDKAILMDKILRELEDLKNSQSSLIKKIGQIEVDNINLGDSQLEKSLSDIYDNISGGMDKATELVSSYQQKRDKFVLDNNLQEALSVSGTEGQ